MNEDNKTYTKKDAKIKIICDLLTSLLNADNVKIAMEENIYEYRKHYEITITAEKEIPHG